MIFCQHGFVSGRSCTTQLLKVVDKWSDVLDQGGALDAIYLDFAKAFDSVPHKRLLGKLSILSSCGIEEEKILQWIQHFLVERRLRVVGAGMFSPWTEVFREYNKDLYLTRCCLCATLKT